MEHIFKAERTLEEGRKLLTEMLAKDVIQCSSSPWASPNVLVGKKDGPVLFCVDYRNVNGITRKDTYLYPGSGHPL